MNFIKTVMLFLCFACITIGIVENIIPDSSLSKVIRIISVLICIVSIVTMFKNKDFQFSDFDFSFSSDESEYYPIMEQAAANSLNQNISDSLKEYSINNATIRIYTDIDKQQSIIINKVVISVDENDIEKAVSASKYLENEYGIDVEIEER